MAATSHGCTYRRSGMCQLCMCRVRSSSLGRPPCCSPVLRTASCTTSTPYSTQPAGITRGNETVTCSGTLRRRRRHGRYTPQPGKLSGTGSRTPYRNNRATHRTRMSHPRRTHHAPVECHDTRKRDSETGRRATKPWHIALHSTIPARLDNSKQHSTAQRSAERSR
jgi:hypothetical protein